MKSKSKKKRWVLGIIAAVLVLAVIGGCLFLFLPGSWKPIDRFSEFQGILDSPIRQVTLRHIGYEVTFTDPDLIQPWQEGLEQLQLRKTGVNPRAMLALTGSWSGGNTNAVTLQTETGEYTRPFGRMRCSFPCFVIPPTIGKTCPLMKPIFRRWNGRELHIIESFTEM